jgi:hypothetical protein
LTNEISRSALYARMVDARLRYSTEVERLKASGQRGIDEACLSALRDWHDAVQALREFERGHHGGSGQPEEGRPYSYDTAIARERVNNARKRYGEAVQAQDKNRRTHVSAQAWAALQEWHEAVRELCTLQETSLGETLHRQAVPSGGEGNSIKADIATFK